MTILPKYLLIVAMSGMANSTFALTGNDCAKKYNKCAGALFADKKSCKKKRSQCDVQVANEARAATQSSTKNRMLSGSSESSSAEARKEAARKRVFDREREKAQAPQSNGMREGIKSN
jgi:hypothetical protein